MSTLTVGDMEKLVNFQAKDGVLEFLHPPGTYDRVEGTEGKKKSLAFSIKDSLPNARPQNGFNRILKYETFEDKQSDRFSVLIT